MDDPANEAADPGRLLDDIRSMNIADVDRERLVNAYLDAVVEPERIREGSLPESSREAAAC